MGGSVRRVFRGLVLLMAFTAFLWVTLVVWWPELAVGALAVVSPRLATQLVIDWKDRMSRTALEQQRRNLETDVIRIELAGRRYNVPLRYSYTEAIDKRGGWPAAKRERVVVGALSISVLLPDLKPYYPEDDSRWKVRGHGERAEISITSPKNYSPDWYQNYRTSIVGGTESNFYTRAGEEHGLIRFQSTGLFDDTYLPMAERMEVLLHCSRDQLPPVPSPSCRVSSNYHGDVILEYSYSQDYLPQWEEIDSKIRKLFDGFEETALDEFGLEKE